MSNGSEISYKPKLICLTGYQGAGKTTVKDMFAFYGDTYTFSDVDDFKKMPEKTKLAVFDSLHIVDELTYLRWTKAFSQVLVTHVDCLNNRRIQRIKDRDHYSELVIGMRDKQEKADINRIMPLVDYNIHNSRSLEDTNGQVYYLYTLLTKEKSVENSIPNIPYRGR